MSASRPTPQYDKRLFILQPTEAAQSAIGKRVTVLDSPDGRLVIRYEGQDRVYRTFDKIRQVKETNIVENDAGRVTGHFRVKAIPVSGQLHSASAFSRHMQGVLRVR